MSYADVDGVQYWIDDRDLGALNDPYKHAAEILVRDVERYLFRETDPQGKANPNYMNPSFLDWAIARFDACKSGSGYITHDVDYDPEQAALKTVLPVEKRTSSTSEVDLGVRNSKSLKASKHAVEDGA